MTQVQVAQALEALMVLMGQNGHVAPKAKAKKQAKPAKMTKAEYLAAKDARILAGFKRKKIEGVVLMDRDDLTKQFNVRPWKGWAERGQIVKAGEKGVEGLFHVSQTREMTEDEVLKFAEK